MSNVTRLDWEILNATADDCENLEQIYLMVCYEVEPVANGEGAQLGHRYRKTDQVYLLHDIADRVRTLVERGLLEVAMDENGHAVHDLNDAAYVWKAWFRMTSQGRALWESSDYASVS